MSSNPIAEEARSVSVSVIWDNERIPVPPDFDYSRLKSGILQGLRNAIPTASLESINAWCNFSNVRESVRQRITAEGVILTEVFTDKLDASDEAIQSFLDQFGPIRHKSGYSNFQAVLILTDDEGFIETIRRLRRNGYVVLMAANQEFLSQSMISEADYVWDWLDLVYGASPFHRFSKDLEAYVATLLHCLDVFREEKIPATCHYIEDMLQSEHLGCNGTATEVIGYAVRHQLVDVYGIDVRSSQLYTRKGQPLWRYINISYSPETVNPDNYSVALELKVQIEASKSRYEAAMKVRTFRYEAALNDLTHIEPHGESLGEVYQILRMLVEDNHLTPNWCCLGISW